MKKNLKCHRKKNMIKALDSLEFLDFIIYIEKKTKKKFLSSNSNDLINLKVKDLSKLFK